MKTEVTYIVGSDTLQTILITSLKTVSVYEDLVHNTQNPYILDWLFKKIKDTSKFILEVQVQLESMGLEPKELSKIQLSTNKILNDLKLMFTRINDEFIIAECLKADRVYLKILSEVKKSILITNELYQIYSQQIESISKTPSNRLKNQNMLLSKVI